MLFITGKAIKAKAAKAAAKAARLRAFPVES